MARVQLPHTAQDELGNAQAGIYYVYARGTTTPVPVFAAETGGSALTQPIAITGGQLNGWVDEGSYDVNIVTDIGSSTRSWEAVRSAPVTSGIQLPSFTLATLPSAVGSTGKIIYVSDAPVGQRVQISDGSTWINNIAFGAGAGGDLKGTYPNPQVDKLTDLTVDVNETTSLLWNGTPDGFLTVQMTTPGYVAGWSCQETATPLVDQGGNALDLNFISSYGGTPLYGQAGPFTWDATKKSLLFQDANPAFHSRNTTGIVDFPNKTAMWVEVLVFIPTGTTMNSGSILQKSYPFGVTGSPFYWEWELAAISAVSGTQYSLSFSRFDSGASGEGIGSPTLTKGAWYHVVAGSDGINMVMWVNNTAMTPAAMVRNINTNNGPVIIGRTSGGGANSGSAPAGVRVAYAAVYAGAPTSATVASHYSVFQTGVTSVPDVGIAHSGYGVMRTQKRWAAQSLALDAYTTITRPRASQNTGVVIYVSDAPTGKNYQYSNGTVWIAPNDLEALNTQTGTTYTLALTDVATAVEMNNAGAMTVTVPPNSSVAFPIGTVIEIVRLGAGTLTIAQGSGVTLPNKIEAAGTTNRTISAQYGVARLRKRATDQWVLSGDLA